MRRFGEGCLPDAIHLGAVTRGHLWEHQQCREYDMGPGTNRAMQRSQVAALQGGGTRVQQRQEAGVGHLCRYMFLPPNYPTVLDFNHCSQTLVPRLPPPASQVVPAQGVPR